MVDINRSLKKRGVVCPFCINCSDYKMPDDLEDRLFCWFKAQDYMQQNKLDTVDAAYAECTRSFTYVDCEFYKSVPSV